jgi:hypothetical protein
MLTRKEARQYRNREVRLMFEAVHPSRADEVPAGLSAYKGDGMVWDRPEGGGYVLWPILRGAYVDAEWQPIRQAVSVRRTLETQPPLLD